MPRPLARLAIVIATLLLLSGCWSAKEIDNLAIVLSIGLDRTDEGRYIVTALIGNLSNPSKSEGSGAKTTGSWIMSVEGDSVFDAFRKLASVVPRRVFWAHAESLVISQRLAKQGIRDLLDILTRDHEPRRSMHLLVAEGEVLETLGSDPVLEQSLSRVLDGLIQNQNLHHAYGQDLNRYLRERNGGRTASLVGILESDQDPLGGASMAPSQRARLHGTAVFWQDRLVGALDDQGERAVRWVQGEQIGGATTIPCPGDPERLITIELKPSRGSIRAGVRGGRPWGEVDVQANGRIVEVHCVQLQLNLATVDTITRAWEAKVATTIRGAVQKAQQELGVDPFGFGDKIFRTDPSAWMRLADQWPDAFRTMSISVRVKARLHDSGLTANPLSEADKRQVLKR